MNRRSFLQALTAVIAAPLAVAAAVASPTPITLSEPFSVSFDWDAADLPRIRFINDYTIALDASPCRFVLAGWATIRPDLACRVVSA